MTGVRMSPETPPPADVAAAATPLVRVEGLTIGFPSASAGTAVAVRGVSLEAFPGETLGIVGESGCGKSLSLRALLGLVPEPGAVLAGEITWKGEVDLVRDQARLRSMRGREISMIFQDPMESLNPVYSVGDQLTEVLRLRAGLSRSAARARAVELLDRVGIPSAAQRLRDYPHQLSGGMRQRVMIAIAIACGPELLLADEPTTALDVTIQDQILSLLAELQQESGLTILLVSHDLGVIAQMADRIAVMYAGHVVETGTVDQVLSAPRHPYTMALIASAPEAVEAGAGGRLMTIGGAPPTITELPAGCAFAPRCRHAQPRCAEVDMRLDRGPGEHASACPVVDANDERRGSDAHGG
jgi:peptide/nickel transport system ATP-binding protein